MKWIWVQLMTHCSSNIFHWILLLKNCGWASSILDFSKRSRLIFICVSKEAKTLIHWTHKSRWMGNLTELASRRSVGIFLTTAALVVISEQKHIPIKRENIVSIRSKFYKLYLMYACNYVFTANEMWVLHISE